MKIKTRLTLLTLTQAPITLASDTDDSYDITLELDPVDLSIIRIDSRLAIIEELLEDIERSLIRLGI